MRSASSDGPSEDDEKIQVSGQVLEVEFVLDRTLLSGRGGPDINDTPPPQDDKGPSAPARPYPSSAQHLTPSDRSGEKPSRSRSPRGPTPTDGSSQPQHATAERVTNAKPLPCDMQLCSPVQLHPKGVLDLLHLPTGHDRWLTLVEPVQSLLAELPMCAAPWMPTESLRMLSTVPSGGASMSDQCVTKLSRQLLLAAKLLMDPPPGSDVADSTVERARIATHLLGELWPRPPFRRPTLQLAEHDESDMEDVLLLEVTFCILTPGYPFERLDVTIMIPQTIQEIVELLQTCRRASHQELFPELVEIRPQPTVGWGFFLAVPTWVCDRCVVCFDLSQWDGRIFADTVPQHVDLWTLLHLADIPQDAEVDVYVPDFQGPLPRGAESEVFLGCCISFMPRHCPPVYSDLLRMLRSPDDWNRGLGVAAMHLANGYCVATAADFFLFRLLPGREMYYRHDIASVARLHHSRLQLVPAAAQPGDVAISGWQCRAVLAAVQSVLSTSWDPTPTMRTNGILDARPLLLGWMPLHTQHDWLDLTSLAEGLNQSAPEGWCVVFPAFPSHWTWIWFTEGQILIAAFALQPNAAEAASQYARENVLDASDAGPDDEGVPVHSPPPTAIEGIQQDASATAPGSSQHTPQQDNAMAVQDKLHLARPREAPPVRTPAASDGDLWDAILLGLFLACYPTELVGGFLVCLFVWASQARGLQSHDRIWPVTRIPALLRIPIFIACLSQLASGVQGMQHTGYQLDKQLHHSETRRPVPTPARNAVWSTLGYPCPAVHYTPASHQQSSGPHEVSELRLVPDSKQNLCSIEHLVTLLEDSVARPDDQAFFLAATLLDAVIEYLEELTSHRALPASPQSLRLQDHVCPPSFNLDVERVTLPHDQMLLNKLFQPWPTSWLLMPGWTCADLPATTVAMLRQIPTWEHFLSSDPSSDVSFSVYSDGSATSDTSVSGYAAVILLHTAATTSLLGVLGGSLLGNPALLGLSTARLRCMRSMSPLRLRFCGACK